MRLRTRTFTAHASARGVRSDFFASCTTTASIERSRLRVAVLRMFGNPVAGPDALTKALFIDRAAVLSGNDGLIFVQSDDLVFSLLAIFGEKFARIAGDRAAPHARCLYRPGGRPVARWNARVKLACEEKAQSSAIWEIGILSSFRSCIARMRRNLLT